MKTCKLYFILIFTVGLLSISSVCAEEFDCKDINITTNEIIVEDQNIQLTEDSNTILERNHNPTEIIFKNNITPKYNDKTIVKENNRFLPQSNYITANDLVKYYKGDNQYYATFYSDLNGHLLVNSQVVVNINEVNYTRTTNSSGMIKLNINLSPGDYIIKAFHPNGDEQDNNIKVISTIEASNLNMFYQDGSKFIVRNLDKNGNPLPYSIVNFNVNGVFYNRTANSTGHAALNINLLPNIYVITVKSFYNNLERSYAINIFHTVTKDTNNAIITPLKKCVYKGENYVAKLCQNNGVPLANEQLNVKIDGNSHYLTTDDQGFVYLSTSSLSVGTHELFIYYGSNYVQRNLIVSNYVSGNNNIITPSNTSIWPGNNAFKVKVTNSVGSPLNNVQVYFYINGVAYLKTTNSNGIVSLNINLNPGIYPIAITSASSTYNSYNPISLYKLIYVANSVTDDNFYDTYSYGINLWINPGDYISGNPIDYANPGTEYIQSLASFLTKYDDELENIVSINNYVSYTTYAHYPGTMEDAIGTLNLFSGNCVDEANAVVALTRGANMPARYVYGNSTSDSDDHMWGQFLVDGLWICFDTSATSGNSKWEGAFKLGNKNYLIQNFIINYYGTMLSNQGMYYYT